ncbi:MAG TPA: alpha/beta fold hydrolase, partial [Azospirillaceae bacterium]|nr:alpha/beta fold hydrolase [Azospirillaceae bacterium]
MSTVMDLRHRHFLGLSAAGFHRVAYTEWGATDAASTVVCAHGLARNGRDFDTLAQALAIGGRRVACPDVVGRGRSDWLADPDLYGYPQYLADMAVLIARLDVETVDWVGTSMGGLIGLFLAARPGAPIRRLVINDVGPFIPKAALARIGSYLGSDPAFDDLAGVEEYLRTIYKGFGALNDAQWRAMAEHSARRRPDGRLGLAYDPGIATPFTAQEPADVDLWAVWDAIR